MQYGWALNLNDKRPVTVKLAANRQTHLLHLYTVLYCKPLCNPPRKNAAAVAEMSSHESGFRG